MKVQKGSLIVIFLSIFIFIQCDHFPLVEDLGNYEFIIFRNNCDDTLVLYVNYQYPDTLMAQNGDVGIGIPHQDSKIEAYASRKYIFKNHQIIQLFIYKLDDVTEFYKNHHPNDPLGGNHLELKRYELTKDWLEEHNWTITYP